jgi:hypothetical protein
MVILKTVVKVKNSDKKLLFLFIHTCKKLPASNKCNDMSLIIAAASSKELAAIAVKN